MSAFFARQLPFGPKKNDSREGLFGTKIVWGINTNTANLFCINVQTIQVVGPFNCLKTAIWC